MAVLMDNSCTATIRAATVSLYVRIWAASNTSLASGNGTQTWEGCTARVATYPFAVCRTDPKSRAMIQCEWQPAEKYVTTAGNTKLINKQHSPVQVQPTEEPLPTLCVCSGVTMATTRHTQYYSAPHNVWQVLIHQLIEILLYVWEMNRLS